MKQTFLAFGTLLITAHLTAQVAPGTVTLQDLRNRARPLLIFASKPDDPQLEIQLRTLQEHAAETQDRDLVPIALPFHAPSPTEVHLSDGDAETARRQYRIPPGDFVVVLLGKDGGEKKRAGKPFTMRQLTEIIDAMPMRQEEMRSKTK